ncbi:MAG TPA: Rrf2 family transcriptional regulator [Candidatus Dormibacteraeota bacterium]|nr:Rrf2 family transcriptional regulator [Candidatus Dormibacteraeota bacterium]
MRISAKADYAVRATAELAASKTTLKAEQLSRAQGIPLKYLLNILVELKHAGLVHSHRGAEGGYELALPASAITVADVIRAVEGPLATVQDARPEDLHYPGAAAELRAVWVALRSSLRSVLEEVTLSDLVSGSLPDHVAQLAASPGAWVSRRAGELDAATHRDPRT